MNKQVKSKIKSTAAIAAVLLSSCLVLSSCGQKPSDAASGYTVLENSYVDYTFEYPEDWTLVENSGMVMVKPENDNVSISLTTFDVGNDTVTSYWYGNEEAGSEGYFEYFKSTLGGSVSVISEEETTLGAEKSPALSVTYDATVAEKDYRFTQVVSIYNGEAYTITYTAKPDTHDTYKGALTHVLSSFRFK